MYEAFLKATPEYQKVAASFGSAGPAARAGGIIHEGRPPWQIPGIGGNR